MLDTECYEELNLFSPEGGPTPDLIESQPPPPPPRGFFDRVFRRRRVRLKSFDILWVQSLFWLSQSLIQSLYWSSKTGSVQWQWLSYRKKNQESSAASALEFDLIIIALVGFYGTFWEAPLNLVYIRDDTDTYLVHRTVDLISNILWHVFQNPDSHWECLPCGLLGSSTDSLCWWQAIHSSADCTAILLQTPYPIPAWHCFVIAHKWVHFTKWMSCHECPYSELQ